MRHPLVALVLLAGACAACTTPARSGGAPGAAGASGAAVPAATQSEWHERSAQPQPDARHVTLLVGERWLDEDEWHPLDDQFTFGIELDEHAPTGHGYEIGLLHSGDDADDLSVPGIGAALSADVETFELYGGYRHTFRAEQEGLHPYVSIGLSVMDGELEGDTAGGDFNESDTTMGAYLRVGMLWDVTSRVRFGLDVRHLVADDWEFASSDVKADYDQALLTVGWAF